MLRNTKLLPVEKRKRSNSQQQRLISQMKRERDQMAKPWRAAVNKLRGQLEKTLLVPDAANRRFQCGRLFENLASEIADGATLLNVYWLFCGSQWQSKLGYDPAREQHFAELEACGIPRLLASPNEGQKSEDWLDELLFRLSSLASWIEAQESLLMWASLEMNRAAWDGQDRNVRLQAMEAGMVATLPTLVEAVSDWGIAGIVAGFSRWPSPQWARILKHAAELVGQHPQVPELDNWIWWRFPIFSRYRWSAAEVYRAAAAEFPRHPALKEEGKGEGPFKSYCVRRGLRFSGTRKSRKEPPLAEFVRKVPVPKKVPDGMPLFFWFDSSLAKVGKKRRKK